MIAHGPNIEVILELSIVVAIVAAAIHYVRFPYTIALVVTGLALAIAPDTPHVEVTPGVILEVFLPILLFYGAYNLDFSELRAASVPVTLLAFPGVAVTAALVGIALHLTTTLAWPQALLFGAIVAATDPVAVLSIFGEVAAPRRLATIVEAESLLNDGTALVLFSALLGVATSSTFDLGITLERFVILVAGALALGAAVAVVGGALLRRIDDALLEMTITLIMAYGGYLLATHLGASGPLETVTAGILFGAQGHKVMSPTTRLQARATWEFLDFLANSLLFLLVGLSVRNIGTFVSVRSAHIWWPLVVAIVAVSVARIVVVWCVHRFMAQRGNPFPSRWSTIITWAGLRGGISLAAALSLPSTLADRNLLLTLTFGIVFFTLLIQGLTMRSLVERLGLGTERTSRHDIELLLGRLRIAEAGAREVDSLAGSQATDEHIVQQLRQERTQQVQELRTQLDKVYHADGTWKRYQELEARRQILIAEQYAARQAYAQGQVSATTLRMLLEEIDGNLAALEAENQEEA